MDEICFFLKNSAIPDLQEFSKFSRLKQTFNPEVQHDCIDLFYWGIFKMFLDGIPNQDFLWFEILSVYCISCSAFWLKWNDLYSFFSVDIQFTLLSVELQRFDGESYNFQYAPTCWHCFLLTCLCLDATSDIRKKWIPLILFFPRILVQTIWKTM